MLDIIRQPTTTPKKAGTLIGWNSRRGFGFLAVDGSNSGDLFVHVSAFESVGLQPHIGHRFAFDAIPDRNGRPQAVNLQAE